MACTLQESDNKKEELWYKTHEKDQLVSSCAFWYHRTHLDFNKERFYGLCSILDPMLH